MKINSFKGNMPYIIKNTEKTRKNCSDYETFSSLYMLAMHSDRKSIKYILVDCFNDVTCSNEQVDKLYDIQSKGCKKNCPKEIGSFLYTLFNNYLSDFPFVDYILFLKKFNAINKLKKKIFYVISDFDEKCIESIKHGIETEIFRRTQRVPSEKDVLYFLDKVKFAICTYTKPDIIKKLIPLKQKKFGDDKFYNSVFDDIRDKQSELKNINLENKELIYPKEVLTYNKYLKTEDISTLLINRIIGAELFATNLPVGLVASMKDFDEEKIKDELLKCHAELAMLFFNKNDKKNIWKLLSIIIKSTKESKYLSTDDIYSHIYENINSRISLGELSVKYLIARIKEGLYD
ncbi:MAG: hypothetical protein ACRC5H_08155 [Treponemataceae bacterium]